MMLWIVVHLWYWIARLILDHKFSFAFKRIARPAGGIAVGFLAHEPTHIFDKDEAHWWAESLVVFLLFWAITFHYRRRVIPHSPILTLQ